MAACRLAPPFLLFRSLTSPRCVQGVLLAKLISSVVRRRRLEDVAVRGDRRWDRNGVTHRV